MGSDVRVGSSPTFGTNNLTIKNMKEKMVSVFVDQEANINIITNYGNLLELTIEDAVKIRKKLETALIISHNPWIFELKK